MQVPGQQNDVHSPVGLRHPHPEGMPIVLMCPRLHTPRTTGITHATHALLPFVSGITLRMTTWLGHRSGDGVPHPRRDNVTHRGRRSPRPIGQFDKEERHVPRTHTATCSPQSSGFGCSAGLQRYVTGRRRPASACAGLPPSMEYPGRPRLLRNASMMPEMPAQQYRSIARYENQLAAPEMYSFGSAERAPATLIDCTTAIGCGNSFVGVHGIVNITCTGTCTAYACRRHLCAGTALLQGLRGGGVMSFFSVCVPVSISGGPWERRLLRSRISRARCECFACAPHGTDMPLITLVFKELAGGTYVRREYPGRWNSSHKFDRVAPYAARFQIDDQGMESGAPGASRRMPCMRMRGGWQ